MVRDEPHELDPAASGDLTLQDLVDEEARGHGRLMRARADVALRLHRRTGDHHLSAGLARLAAVPELEVRPLRALVVVHAVLVDQAEVPAHRSVRLIRADVT